jgi:hypothetical protein
MSRHITRGPDFDSFCNRYSHALLEIVKKRTAQRLAAKRTAKAKRKRSEKLGLRCISTRFGRLSNLEPNLCPF